MHRRVKDLREDYDFTKEYLAQYLSCSQSAYPKIESGETALDALVKETREEVGLVIKPNSITPYGYVHRRLKSRQEPSVCFVQDNFYYLCEAEDQTLAQELDRYEAEEGYRLVFVAAQAVLDKNFSVGETPYDRTMIEREAKVVERLVVEGVLA